MKVPWSSALAALVMVLAIGWSQATSAEPLILFIQISADQEAQLLYVAMARASSWG